MQVRPLRAEELDRFAIIERDAFLIENSSIPPWIEHTLRPNVDNIRVLEQDNELVSVLRIIYTELWLGQGRVKMAGVTSVATPIEHRRFGYLKILLRTVMQELRENGYAISTLYPFDFPFYKKFGYEQVSTEKEIKVKIGALQPLRSKSSGKGKWKAVKPEQWTELNAIYEASCVGRFGSFTRDAYWWQKRIFSDYRNINTNFPAYIWEDENGHAKAYIVYEFKSLPGSWDRELIVRDQAWLDPQARIELLVFIVNHDAQANKVIWKGGADQEIFALLQDPREAEENVRPGYMMRILDAKRALTERKWPQNLTCNFSLALRDDRLEWNNNITLQVAIEAGQAEINSSEGVDKAGLSCDIRQLSQMYAGYLSPVQLVDLGLLEVRDFGELEAAQQAFFAIDQSASYMPDHF